MLQASGLCVVADKLNFIRYLSHFRCVHRGAAFAQMRTTTVRKLLPESWGFLCPVHTPDGTPCGLMNHLTVHCEIVASVHPTTTLPALLCSLGRLEILTNGRGTIIHLLQFLHFFFHLLNSFVTVTQMDTH